MLNKCKFTDVMNTNSSEAFCNDNTTTGGMFIVHKNWLNWTIGHQLKMEIMPI